jgi:hypothetical protein
MSPAAFTSGAFGFGALEEPEALAEPLDAVVAAVPPQPANITAAAAATSADDAARPAWRSRCASRGILRKRDEVRAERVMTQHGAAAGMSPR